MRNLSEYVYSEYFDPKVFPQVRKPSCPFSNDDDYDDDYVDDDDDYDDHGDDHANNLFTPFRSLTKQWKCVHI